MARSILFDPAMESAAIDELGDNIDRTIDGSSHIMNWHNIGMIQAGDHPRFGKILFGILPLLESFGGGNFDGDLAVQLSVKSQIDSSERTLSQDPLKED